MKYDLLIVLNFIACMSVVWASFCRLNASSKRIRKLDRLKYVAMMVTSGACAFQGPLFGEYPGIADVLFASAVFGYILMGVRRWHSGPPDSSAMPLNESSP
jgi:hypothetical protein